MKEKIKQKRIAILQKIISSVRIKKRVGWQELVKFHQDKIERLKKDG